MKVLLVSENELKNSSIIEQGIDGKLIASTILSVQEIHLKPILGVNLYNTIINVIYDFQVNNTPIDGLYIDLLTIIKAYLINKVVAEFIIPNQYKMTAKGLMKFNDNSASNLSDSDVNSVKDYYDNLSTTYKKNLIEFIQLNDLVEGCNTDTSLNGDATGIWLGNFHNCVENETVKIEHSDKKIIDVYVSGGTFSGGTTVFTNTTGGTFSVSGYSNGSYTNLNPTPITLGGVTAGSTFNEETINEILDQLFYPYQVPAFNSFGLGISLTQEVGYTLANPINFSWSTSNSSNVSPNTISLAGYNLTTLTGLANDGSESVNFTGSVTRSSIDGVGTRTWTISGINTKSNLFSTSLSIRWDYKMYVGTSINTSLNESQIKALSNYNSLKNGFAGTYNLSAGGYKYFCFATNYGTPNSFVDTSNNLNIGMYGGYPNIDSNGNTYDLVSVTNGNGQTTNYRIYRTLNILGSTINIAVN